MALPETPILAIAARRIPKATYVPLKLEEKRTRNGRAVIKFGFVRNLSLQQGEIDVIRRKINRSESIDFNDSVWNTLRSFEGSPIPSQLPSPSVFTNVPINFLKAFGEAIVTHRQQVMETSSDGNSGATMALILHNAAAVATNGFEANVTVTPIGMLNLERIEMSPAGIQRGELIATIPLAPMEQTAVVHKEWSVTTQEFTSIVTDSLENYSETGVTENTELAQSTASQNMHNNQFNINATVSGTYGLVTATVASAFSAQDQTSNSATESRKHAISTTRKASSRVKQEHKVTISTTTVTGTSETSTRMLQNPSTTDPIRIDYFSIMRKWHVGLYRYGLRLTYDIAIPEPGATMRRNYAQLDDLRNKNGPFTFPITFSEISRDNTHYQDLAQQYSVQVPIPPADLPPLRPNMTPSVGEYWHFNHLDFEIPPGYQISRVHLFVDYGGINGRGNPSIVIEGISPLFVKVAANHDADHVDEDIPGFLVGAEGPQVVYFNIVNAAQAFVGLEVSIVPNQESIHQWQSNVWNALYNAAQTQYYAKQQEIQAEIVALQDKINNVDTLTLRREENEEIMKEVLRWLLGPTFNFMPENVKDLYSASTNADLDHGIAIDVGNASAVTAQGWMPMFQYQEMVKFINEAIEWESVLYFLYSYFWDIPQSWDFIREIRHPDSTRQAFLRAGSARVVLTVRKGWEEAWVNFVEAGGFSRSLIPNHPYMTIATEIHNYDETNYPGIPPANPGGDPLPDSGESVATVSSDSLTPDTHSVVIEVKSSDGFGVGHTAIIDNYDSKDPTNSNITLQEKQTIMEIPDSTHITVERINNSHDGSNKPFVIMQAGEKGQLIAEWFEYTPTSGTDIAVTSNLATIA